MPHISVIVPVYKAENTLLELYRRLSATLQTLSHDYEIILIEDCGGDRSWKIITELAQQDKKIRGFQFSRNFGQHYGITAGLDHCEGDWVVIMDCDLQDRPEEIPKLYQKAQEGYDVVLAYRSTRNDPGIRIFFSWFFHKVLSYFLDINTNYEAANFRIISRQVVLSYRHMREQSRFLEGLMSWMGFPTTGISVEHCSRTSGTSTYTFRKRCRLALQTVTHSNKLLQLSIKFGFVMAFLAILYSFFLLWNQDQTGNSLVASIYFMGGLIIVLLGIIGLYLGKIFDEAKNRPLYVISKRV